MRESGSGAGRRGAADERSADSERLARTQTSDGSSPGTDVPAADPLLLGRTLQRRYRVEQPLGRGGMGLVYRARDVELQRDVAVKLLAPTHTLDRARRERLLREARSAAALNHPNIVGVYDIGEEDGSPFMVMEIVPGVSLRDRGPLELAQVIDVARQLCEALDHAHSNGIVHRDLKPENILLAGEADSPTVKLTDLGIALSCSSGRLTDEGAIVGTAAYLAPEQALGAELDGRADLYALGVVLYELVTGRLPFRGRGLLEVVSQHLHAPVVPPRSFRSDCPAALEAIILKLLAKEPARRFASAREVAGRLAALEHESAAETPAAALTLLEGLTRGRLVGRAEELQQLVELWRRAAQGQGHMALISGEPGSGKTRLARELTVQAQIAGGTVLSGGCYEYEATTPYLPFVEALRQWVHAASDEALQQAIGSAPSELVKLAPEIRDRLPSIAEAPPLAPQEQRLRLFDHVARFLQALAARSGLLLLIDDLHWADQGTIALLHYVLRHLRDERLLILGVYREMELDRVHPLAAALVDWNRERVATRVQLGRLSLDETREMLAALLDQETLSEEFARAIHRETEGNPFFTEEMVKSLIEQGQVFREGGGWQRREIGELTIPQGVRAAIGRRLDRLSAKCTEVLHIASALGKSFSFDELFAAIGGDEDSLLDALDEAGSKQLVAGRGAEEFVFTHDKIREVLYVELNPVRRRKLHRRIAVALRDLETGGGKVRNQDLAHHFLQAGDLDPGLRYSVAAAEQAECVFAHDEALEFYRRAQECAEELHRPQELARIAEAMAMVHSAAGEAALAAAQYERAVELTDAPDRKLALMCRAGEAYVRVGDPRGLELARVAMESLDPERQPVELARANAMRGRYHHLHGRHRRATEYLERALELAETSADPRTLADIYSFLSGAYQHLACFERSNEWARKCLRLSQTRDSLYSVALGNEFQAENANCQGRWKQALRFARRDHDAAERVQSRERLAWAAYCRGFALRGLGRLAQAEQTLLEALKLTERIDERRLAILLRVELSMLRCDRGRMDQAREDAQQALERAEELTLLWGRLEARRALCYIALQQGDGPPVLEHAGQARRLYADTDGRVHRLVNGATVCEALLLVGRVDDAERALEEQLELARNTDAPHAEGVTLRVRGQMYAALDRHDEAQADLEAAVTGLEALESKIELGRALLHRGTLGAARGAPDEGRADLDRSLALFRAAGAVVDARAAEARRTRI